MSFSDTSTRTSIWLKSAIRAISVPVIWIVPTTRSPCSTLSKLTIPVMGAYTLVRARLVCTSERAACWLLTWKSAALACSSAERMAATLASRLACATSTAFWACSRSASLRRPSALRGPARSRACRATARVASSCLRVARACSMAAREVAAWARAASTAARVWLTREATASGSMRAMRSPSRTLSPSATASSKISPETSLEIATSVTGKIRPEALTRSSMGERSATPISTGVPSGLPRLLATAHATRAPTRTTPRAMNARRRVFGVIAGA